MSRPEFSNLYCICKQNNAHFHIINTILEQKYVSDEIIYFEANINNL